jgi:hypothetical protein
VILRLENGRGVFGVRSAVGEVSPTAVSLGDGGCGRNGGRELRAVVVGMRALFRAARFINQ